jgi:hypothetical protein
MVTYTFVNGEQAILQFPVLSWKVAHQAFASKQEWSWPCNDRVLTPLTIIHKSLSLQGHLYPLFVEGLTFQYGTGNCQMVYYISTWKYMIIKLFMQERQQYNNKKYFKLKYGMQGLNL